ncbi:hypothetical protein [Haloarcula halophila]|uniref:hypothetical protein n=1 Tax=Haloarcula TaxID=2237 RepID=UPI0023E464DB|nr:hypothetical protein [Halomicroarcula sp. DFY41]
MELISPVVEQVIEIAREQLERPIKVRLWTWEDGEFQVRVKHWYPAGSENRYGYEAVIQYHSRSEEVEGVLVEEDTIDDEKERLLKQTVAHIPDPVPRKNEDGSSATAP